MNVFEGKIRDQLSKLGGNKVLRSRHRAAMFIVNFANFKSSPLSCKFALFSLLWQVSILGIYGTLLPPPMLLKITAKRHY